MDELDRIYRRLAQNIRAGFPELLTRPFEVSQIYQQIMPYRLNRRELGFDTNEDYELALTQMLSGARGMLLGDEEMQRALRKQLESPNPDLSAYRAFATSMVSLSPDALRALDAQPAVRSSSLSGPAPAITRAPGEQAVLAARATEEVGGAQRRVPEPPPPLGSRAGAHSAARPAAPAPVTRAATADECRYCGGTLPEGKKIVFCPHCGHDLTIQHCPACNTELDVGWKYCITCGREVGAK